MIPEALKRYDGMSLRLILAVSIAALTLVVTLVFHQDDKLSRTKPYIIQGYSLAKARMAVEGSGAKVTKTLTIIQAVAARLTLDQYDYLDQHRDIKRIYPDVQIATAVRYEAHGAPLVTVIGNVASWSITNSGRRDLIIDSIDIGWSADNGNLTQVSTKTGGRQRTIHDLDAAPVSAFIDSGWVEPGVLLSGNDTELQFHFDNIPADAPESYQITVAFADGLRITYEANGAYVDQGRQRDTFYPGEVDADQLHLAGITGRGVTIAVVDTGLWQHSSLSNAGRILASFDAMTSSLNDHMVDRNGHGTHLTSVMASSGQAQTGSYNGIAPEANLVAIKAFDRNGSGTYSQVISAIDFVVTNTELYNIRVLNLSLSGEVRSHYWDDPLNQAVMRAHQAGIVVVASAGDTGPDAMTIGVPGNVPYVITVGAMTETCGIASTRSIQNG